MSWREDNDWQGMQLIAKPSKKTGYYMPFESTEANPRKQILQDIEAKRNQIRFATKGRLIVDADSGETFSQYLVRDDDADLDGDAGVMAFPAAQGFPRQGDKTGRKKDTFFVRRTTRTLPPIFSFLRFQT